MTRFLQTRVRRSLWFIFSSALVSSTIVVASFVPEPEIVNAAACVDGTHYTASSAGGQTVLTFTANCDYTLPATATSVSYLLVGGGGGGGAGGNTRGGQGGRGGVVVSATVTGTASKVATIVVGAGGTGGSTAGGGSNGTAG